MAYIIQAMRCAALGSYPSDIGEAWAATGGMHAGFLVVRSGPARRSAKCGRRQPTSMNTVPFATLTG